MFDLERMFDDCLKHLGIDAEYQPNGETSSKIIRACCTHPENMYDAGTSQMVGQVAEIAVKSNDICMCGMHPKIGDYIIIGTKKYKICDEPLLDPSNLLFKIKAVLVR